MRFPGICLVLTLLVSSSPTRTVPGMGQPNAPATGAITGAVVDAVTRTPVPDVLVYLSTRGRGTVGSQSRQLTDTKGRFAFVNLPPGTAYTIATNKFGYLDGGFISDGGPGGSPGFIAVKDGEWVQNIHIQIFRPGAVSGVVVDEQGDPVVGVVVRVLHRLRIQGHDELGAGPLALTDDRGGYRIGGLGPGRYVVQVPSVQASLPLTTPLVAARDGTIEAAVEFDAGQRLVLSRYPLPPPPMNGRPLAYPPTFYPGTATAAQAGTIDLKYGEDRIGIDLRLEPVMTSRISGVVQGPPDALPGVILRLLPAGLENLGQGSEAGTANVEADGRFTFLNVPAGAYTIDASRGVNELTSVPFSGPAGNGGPVFPQPPGRQGSSRSSRGVDANPPGLMFSTSSFGGNQTTYSGRTSVVVTGADVANVAVSLRSGATMSGSFIREIDPKQPSPAQSRLVALLDPAGGNPAMGMPQSAFQQDGADEFEISGLLSGEYWLRVPSTGWLVKSIQWKGKDYTTAPFDTAATNAINGIVVTVTTAAPTLTGTVHERDGQAAAGTTVLIFPADRAQWTNFGLAPARIKKIGVDNTGTFSLTTLPAGDYYVLAVTTAPAAWLDPDFFAKIEGNATRVTLSWGRQTNADLTLGAVR